MKFKIHTGQPGTYGSSASIILLYSAELNLIIFITTCWKSLMVQLLNFSTMVLNGWAFLPPGLWAWKYSFWNQGQWAIKVVGQFKNCPRLTFKPHIPRNHVILRTPISLWLATRKDLLYNGRAGMVWIGGGRNYLFMSLIWSLSNPKHKEG